jgi:aminoglycoside 6'-N-acetyltransferase
VTPPRQTVRGQLTVVRPATDADVDLLVAWHADPEISRYWDDETFTPEQMLERLDRERVDASIVEANGEPVGYLQSWWEEDDPLRGGLDGFLVPAARGRGLMPDAARRLAGSLLDAGWQYVTVDPYAWNEQGLRGWTNAGFVEVSRHEPDQDHRSEWVLMRFQPESGSADTESGSTQTRT